MGGSPASSVANTGSWWLLAGLVCCILAASGSGPEALWVLLPLALALTISPTDGSSEPLSLDSAVELARLPIENPHPVLRIRGGRLVYANAPAREALALGATTDAAALPGLLLEALKAVEQSNSPRFVEVQVATRVFALTVVAGHEPGVANVYGMDVTGRVEVEARSAQLNRFLRTMLACQNAIARATAEAQLFEEVCDAVAEDDRRVWVVLLTGQGQEPCPAAASGFGASSLPSSAAERQEQRRGLVEAALARGEVVVERADGAALAAPLRRGPDPIGALVLEASAADAFGPDEVALLSQLADDLSFAVDSLRTRRSRDIAVAALEESEQRFEQALLEAPWPVMLHAEGGEVLAVSRAWTGLTGYSVDELATLEAWCKRAYGADWEGPLRRIKQLVELSEPQDGGQRAIRTARGEQRIWQFHSAPLGTLSDGRRLVLSSAFDVTERAQHEQDLQRLNSQLEARVRERTARLETAHRDLQEFSYSVSHDLRAPLRAIHGFAQLLGRRCREELGPDGQRLLANILHASSQMNRLIDDLLDYARVGRHEVRREEIALGDLLEELAQEFTDRAARSGVSITWPVGDALPTLSTDAILLRKSLANLIDNALTYRRAEDPRVEILAEGGPDGICLAVRDNGIGIDQDQQERIFEAFRRLHSAAEYPGTGIGLASVKRSMELLGGAVDVVSRPGEGSTFRLWLPKRRS